MRFSIILPTFKNSDSLKHAVISLQSQTYTNWELIIVNDSPKDYTYKDFSSNINDPRIHYHTNESMRGENYSKNLALEKISSDSKWVIFLDDSHYFSPDTLATLSNLILTNPEQKWFASNVALKDGTPLTNFPHDESTYTYIWKRLLLGKGEVPSTHCIETKLITHNHIRFSEYVKQGEDWFFLYQIGLHSKIYYHDHNSTIIDRCDHPIGLTFRNRYESILQLFYEGGRKRILKPSFLIYLALQTLRLVIPKR